MSEDPSPEALFLWGAEVHSVERIVRALEAGVEVDAPLRGFTPVEWLVERMYLRSPRLPECLDALVDAGATFEDRALLAVLRDDPEALRRELDDDPQSIHARRTLACSFTSLDGVSLLHVAAEFGSLDAARALLDAGADIDLRADLDGHGLGGHTAIFHTVNQHENHCQPVLRLLLERGARTDLRLAGLVWGRGFEWETIFFDVTLLSYTQLGLLPWFQRGEEQIWENVRLILESRGDTVPPLNVPNAYTRRREPPS